MLAKQIKDSGTRKKLRRLELKRVSYKYILSRLSSSRFGCRSLRHPSGFKNLFRTKIRRRCVLTNRVRGVQTEYNISRVKLREMLQFGLIPGYKKSI